jgi:DNA-binding PadR family transcriptional regulator
MLSHLVMHRLAQGPLSGYGLCKELERSTGHKPSYGSIYPLLERLSQEGSVSAREEGRKKVYSLTRAGKEKARRLDQRREELVGGLMGQMRALMELTGEDPGPLMVFLERLRKGEPPLGPVSHQMLRFRDLMFTMVQDGRAQRHKKEINGMLKEMVARLEALP